MSSRGSVSPDSFAPTCARGSDTKLKERFLLASVPLGRREYGILIFFWCRYQVVFGMSFPPSHLLHSHHYLAMLMSNGVFFAELEAGEGVSIRCGLRSVFARRLSEFNSTYIVIIHKYTKDILKFATTKIKLVEITENYEELPKLTNIGLAH